MCKHLLKARPVHWAYILPSDNVLNLLWSPISLLAFLYNLQDTAYDL